MFQKTAPHFIVHTISDIAERALCEYFPHTGYGVLK